MFVTYSTDFILSQIPRNYFKISKKAFALNLKYTPYSYSMYIKMLLNYNEFLKDKDQTKKNIISINTLVEYCSLSEIKRMKGKDFRLKRHFIEVLEKNLQALESEGLIRYKYIGLKNESTYEEYLKNNIEIEWLEKPDIKTFFNKNKENISNALKRGNTPTL